MIIFLYSRSSKLFFGLKTASSQRVQGTRGVRVRVRFHVVSRAIRPPTLPARRVGHTLARSACENRARQNGHERKRTNNSSRSRTTDRRPAKDARRATTNDRERRRRRNRVRAYQGHSRHARAPPCSSQQIETAFGRHGPAVLRMRPQYRFPTRNVFHAASGHTCAPSPRRAPAVRRARPPRVVLPAKPSAAEAVRGPFLRNRTGRDAAAGFARAWPCPCRASRRQRCRNATRDGPLSTSRGLTDAGWHGFMFSTGTRRFQGPHAKRPFVGFLISARLLVGGQRQSFVIFVHKLQNFDYT